MCRSRGVPFEQAPIVPAATADTPHGHVHDGDHRCRSDVSRNLVCGSVFWIAIAQSNYPDAGEIVVQDMFSHGRSRNRASRGGERSECAAIGRCGGERSTSIVRSLGTSRKRNRQPLRLCSEPVAASWQRSSERRRYAAPQRVAKRTGGGKSAAMFHLAHDGDMARLTLNRPEARNAIPASGWARLEGSAGRGASVRRQGAGRERRRPRLSAPAPTSTISPQCAATRPRGRAFRVAMRAALERLRSARHSDDRRDRRRLLRGRRRARHGLRHPHRGTGGELRDHAGQARHLLSAGGCAPAGRPGRAGPGGAAAAQRGQHRRGEAARIGLVEMLAESAREEAELLARAIAAGSSASHRALKRGIGLAGGGDVRSDATQDRVSTP